MRDKAKLMFVFICRLFLFFCHCRCLGKKVRESELSSDVLGKRLTVNEKEREREREINAKKKVLSASFSAVNIFS